MDSSTVASQIPSTTAGYAAIVGSPIACLILLLMAVVYFIRRDAARDIECRGERDTAAKELKDFRMAAAAELKNERDVHRNYLETQAAQMVRALSESTEATRLNVAASNNLAAVATANTAATVQLTASYSRTHHA